MHNSERQDELPDQKRVTYCTPLKQAEHFGVHSDFERSPAEKLSMPIDYEEVSNFPPQQEDLAAIYWIKTTAVANVCRYREQKRLGSKITTAVSDIVGMYASNKNYINMRLRCESNFKREDLTTATLEKPRSNISVCAATHAVCSTRISSREYTPFLFLLSYVFRRSVPRPHNQWMHFMAIVPDSCCPRNFIDL